MLGSMSEAEDAVQEAWLRLSRSDASAVQNLGGWLTTVVARVCLDLLRARRARREDYAGSWLPEPVVVVDDTADPEQEAVLADSVGLALLVVLRIDVGGARPGAREPIIGAEAVARQVLARGSRLAPFATPAIVNGAAGVVVAPGGRPFTVVAFTVSGGRIAAIDLVADPAKLVRLAPALAGEPAPDLL